MHTSKIRINITAVNMSMSSASAWYSDGTMLVHSHIHSLPVSEGKVQWSIRFIDQVGEAVQFTSHPSHTVPGDELRTQGYQKMRVHLGQRYLSVSNGYCSVNNKLMQGTSFIHIY